MQPNPRYGYFPWWPQDGDDWIHPEDIEVARRVLPSWRIWRREVTRSRYDLLTYGNLHIRILPALWVEVIGEGIEVGDWVEVKSRLQQNTYRVAKVREVLWDEHASAVRYQVDVTQLQLPNSFARQDLRRLSTPPIHPDAATDAKEESES